MPCVNWKARRSTVQMQSTPLCAQKKQQSSLELGVGGGGMGGAWQHVVGVWFHATRPRRAGTWWENIFCEVHWREKERRGVFSHN